MPGRRVFVKPGAPAVIFQDAATSAPVGDSPEPQAAHAPLTRQSKAKTATVRRVVEMQAQLPVISEDSEEYVDAVAAMSASLVDGDAVNSPNTLTLTETLTVSPRDTPLSESVDLKANLDANGGATHVVCRRGKREKHRAVFERLVWVALCSYIGVFVRVSVTSVSKLLPALAYVGTGFFLPNVIGCFAMGVFVSLHSHFAKYPSAYTGLTSGFCGCCTTFATWMASAAHEGLEKHWDRWGLQLLASFCASHCAYVCGVHTGRAVEERCFLKTEQRNKERQNEVTAAPTPNGPRNKESIVKVLRDVFQHRDRQHLHKLYLRLRPRPLQFALACFLLVTLLTWVGAFFDPSTTRARWWIAVGFAPCGAIIRYMLSLYNSRTPNFPTFTFVANIVAATINMIIYLGRDQVEEGALHENYMNFKFWLMSGVSAGFMGSLSTVSTWVNELNKFVDSQDEWPAYRYGFISVVVAQVLCLSVGALWRAFVF